MDSHYDFPHFDYETGIGFFTIVAEQVDISGYTIYVHFSVDNKKTNESFCMGYFKNASFVAQFALLMKTKEL